MVAAARLHRTSRADVSVDSSSTGAVHAWARRHHVVSGAPNSLDSVGMSVRVISRPVQRLVTAVAEFGIYGKCMNLEAQGGDEKNNSLHSLQ